MKNQKKWSIYERASVVLKIEPCVGFIAPPPGHFIHTLRYDELVNTGNE